MSTASRAHRFSWRSFARWRLQLGWLLALWQTGLPLQAQTAPPLERLISVDLRDVSVRTALGQISAAGGFAFSYNPALILSDASVSVRLQQAPAREALNQVFGGRVAYKTRGNHVILLRQPPLPAEARVITIEGYVVDARTGGQISQASVFDKTTLTSALSSAYGYFRLRLRVPPTGPLPRLEVRRHGYQPESVLLRTRTAHSLTVRLSSLPPAALRPRILPSGARLPSSSPERPGSQRLPASLPAPAAEETLVASADPRPPRTPRFARTWRGLSQLLTSAEQAVHDVNLSRDTLARDWQMSFLPNLGTNHRLSGQISNRYSVNLVAGRAYAVRALEIGVGANLVRRTVKGVQMAGGANLVGESVRGGQAACVLNLVSTDVTGSQFAGGGNIIQGRLHGAQVALAGNFVGADVMGGQVAAGVNVARGTLRGVQVAAVGNVGKGFCASQVAGLFNRLNQSADSAVPAKSGGWITQVAGGGNICKSTARGFQLAGVLNYQERGADSAVACAAGWRVQVAGGVNAAQGDVCGVQLASLANVARHVRGAQLGLLNMADSVEGVSVGLLSLVRRGYHRGEAWVGENTQLNAGLKLGSSPYFYNLLAVGIQPLGGDFRWGLGYGIGTEIRLRPRLLLSADVLFYHVNEKKFWTRRLNQLTQFRPLLGWQLAPNRRTSLLAGPTFNVLATQVDSKLGEDLPTFFRRTQGATQVGAWLGVQAGVRF